MFNHVSLRVRTLAAVLVVLACLVAILLAMTDSIIGRSFRALEERTVRERIEQVANAVDDSLASVNRVARDYAVWDASYAFVQTRDPAYVADNMVDVTFLNNRVSYIAFVDPHGDPAYVGAYDLASGEQIAPPAELLRFDGLNAQLLQHGTTGAGLTGLLVLAEGPMLLAAQPILTSQGEGPPAGTLLMGRLLTPAEVTRLSEITRLPLTISQRDAPDLAPHLEQAAAALGGGQATVVHVLDTGRVSGVTAIPDLRGGPGVLLHIELPREIFQLGQGATREYTLVLLGAGLLFAAIVLWLIESAVLTRLIDLSRQVATLEVSQPGTQVTSSGRDEIGQLGDAINQMLGRLAQAQAQIVESERRYRQLLEISPDAIIMHDGQQIRYANAAGVRLLGSGTAAAAAGQPVHAEIAAIQPHADGTPVLVDRVLTGADGNVIEAELVVLPFRDHNDMASQVIVRNITERKQVEKALRAAKEAADAANRAKSQFLATMSHELRTPLTAIIGYAELIERALHRMAGTDVHRDLGRIRAAGSHLLAIINDVLDLSKIEADRMQIDLATVQVAPLVTAVVDSVRPQAERNGNQIVIAGLEAGGTIVTDEVRLRQILVNLAGNACKFTHDGTVTLTVSRPDDEQIEFRVEDTGIGMRADQVAMLFRDFVQVDSSSTRKYGGTGLGLALSRRLARLLGGDIRVHSELGAGSTFTLALPVHFSAPPAPGEQAPEPLLAPSSAREAAAVEPVAETRIVLVIDDDPAVRDLLPRALAHPDLHFETAASGAEGLELAAALLPDLVILDVLLPELDGWSVLQRLKADPETSAIPVLMLTIEHDAGYGFVLGAAGFLQKPVDTDRIAREIAMILGGSTSPLHVLLVEDDAEVRGYLRRTLEHGGWSVDEAGDGSAALALLEERHPALAVIDLMLPGMDGIALIAAIRARPQGDTLPILVVTAKDLSPAEQEQLNRSVEQVLHKGSFRGDDLLRTTRVLVHPHTSTHQPHGGSHGMYPPR